MITGRLCNNNRCWLSVLSLLMSGLALGQGAGSYHPAAMMSESDHAFVHEAAASGNLEIQMSRIAALRANSDRVRQFAIDLVEDHSNARRKLKEIAWSKNIDISDALDAGRAQRLSTLLRYTGDAFDREYLTLQVDQHRRMVRLFEERAQKSLIDGLRGFAQSKLPALEAHLKLAQTLADSR